MAEFRGFQYKIVDVVTDAIQPLLEQAQAIRGVQKAVLVTDDSKLWSPVEVDQLAVLANLQAFVEVLSYASESFAVTCLFEIADTCDAVDVVGDTPTCVVMDGPKSSRLMMWQMTKATFVLQCVKTLKIEGELALIIDMLKRVCVWVVQLSAAR